MIYAISDLHFGHKNIISHCNRPFATVEEMDEAMERNWNDTVLNDSDTVYVVGDFSFNGRKGDLLPLFSRLRGKKHLIRGNHDHTVTRKLPWESVEHDFRGEIYGKWVHMYHYPVVAWDKQFHGSIHVFGHTHERFPWPLERIKNCWSAAVENNDYRPVEFKKIFEQVERRNARISDPRKGREW